jgi:hypothetical protein
MKIFRAEPGRVASFAPGHTQVVLSRPGRLSRRAEPREVLQTNSIEHAPIERFDSRFLETMRVKGWLKDKHRKPAR